MSDDKEDDDFEMNQSDEDDRGIEKEIREQSLNCSTCGNNFVFVPTKENPDYLSLGMCDDCANKLKASLDLLKQAEKSLDKMNGVSASFPSVPFTDESGDEHGDGDDGDGGDGDGGDGGGGDDGGGYDGPPSVPSSDSTRIPTLTDNKSSNGSDKLNVKDDDMTFDVMLTAVFSCGSKSGRVKIHDHEYEFSACPKHISGRGGGTTMINTEFSKSIPDLFGYYFYAGMYTRCFSCMAFTMTECGNLFMGVMETMCNKCRVDPVIYFVETNTCRIISDRLWRRQFKLNCILMLTIDIEKAKR